MYFAIHPLCSKAVLSADSLCMAGLFDPLPTCKIENANVSYLIHYRSTTVDNNRPDAGLVAKFLGLVKDLATQLTGGG